MIGLNRRHPGRLLAIPVLLLFTVLTACSGAGGQAPSSTPTPSAAAAVTVNSQPRSVVASGGELRLPVGGFGDQWNPLHADADADTRLITSTLLPRLFNDDGTGNPSPNPDYLSAVNATGDNPQVVTYTLNPGAVWGDGKAISAADFIADWQACNGQNVSFKCADTKGMAEVASVKQGSTAQQVVVTYRGAYDDWPSTFNTLLPAAGVKDPETFNDGWKSLTKVSDWTAGPFQVDRLDDREGLLTEKPNAEWWGDQPKLAQLTFRRFAAKDRINALKQNRIDAVDLTADSSKSAEISKIANCEVREASVPGGTSQFVATRRSLANYGAFGKSSVIWPDVGYLPPTS